MILLAINTAQTDCDLCLIDGAGTSRLMREEMARGQDTALPGLVEALLAKAGTSWQALERIAVCTGPGSFTGIRIGVAYARGLALALGIPCVGVTSLQACLDPEASLPVRVALQAQKRPPDITFWTQQVSAPGATRTEAEEWPLEALLALSAVSDRPDILASATEPVRPQARYVAAWGRLLDPAQHPPSPAYARAPDAALPGSRMP